MKRKNEKKNDGQVLFDLRFSPLYFSSNFPYSANALYQLIISLYIIIPACASFIFPIGSTIFCSIPLLLLSNVGVINNNNDNNTHPTTIIKRKRGDKYNSADLFLMGKKFR